MRERTSLTIAVVAAIFLMVVSCGESGDSEASPMPIRVSSFLKLSPDSACEATEAVSSSTWDPVYNEAFTFCAQLASVNEDKGQSGGYVTVLGSLISVRLLESGGGSAPDMGGALFNEMFVNLPPGTQYIDCMTLYLKELAGELLEALPPSDCATVVIDITYRGTMEDGGSVESDKYQFFVEACPGGLADVPVGDACCDDISVNPCIVGQDQKFDCRLRREEYDSVHGLQGWQADDGSMLERSTCCPRWPEYCGQ